jgi:hypothetical protein
LIFCNANMVKPPLFRLMSYDITSDHKINQDIKCIIFKLSRSVTLKMSGLAGVTPVDCRSTSSRRDPRPPILARCVDNMCRVVLG